MGDRAGLPARAAGSAARMKIGQLVLALFLPGIAVGAKCGFFSSEAGIAWLLTLFGHVPGVIYALMKISAN